MKKFFRSAWGKTGAFAVCLISLAIFIGSIASIFIYINEDVYSMSSEQLRYSLTRSTVIRKGRKIVDYLHDGSDDPESRLTNTSLVYRIYDDSGKLLAESDNSSSVTEWTYRWQYRYETLEHMTDVIVIPVDEAPNGQETYIFMGYLPDDSKVIDDLWLLGTLAVIIYNLRFAVYFIALIALVAFFGFLFTLLTNAGRNNDDDQIHPGPFHFIPADVLIVLTMVPFVFAFASGEFIAACLALSVGAVAALLLAMAMAVRIKDGTIIKDSLTVFVFKLILACLIWVKNRISNLISAIMNNIPLVIKVAMLIGVLCLIEIPIVVSYSGEIRAMTWVLERILLAACGIYVGLNMQRLKTSALKLAQGDLNYQTDTRGMLPEFRMHGENLNSIASGMKIAVEDSLKSERMKTELITNVSHDLKTPLTSLVNYSSLIANEETDNPKIKEYSEVLLRQSEKLKRLIEDLVEASKATTGNLEVEMSRCDAAVFLEQAEGEYHEKLEAAGLQLVTRLPENEIAIMADGRRMWRIFDNLMNNICKYSQPSTRVYLSLEQVGSEAVITFRNTSREQLDMSEEELMQRFTRGDSSRNTEGNGLGLSIARSLAELQGGSLSLSIDGDLFKAILKFPVIQ